VDKNFYNVYYIFDINILFNLFISALTFKKFNFLFEMNGCLRCYEVIKSPFLEKRMDQLIDSGKERILGKGYIPSDYRHSPFMGDRKHGDNLKSTGNAIIIKLNNTYDISMITIGVNDHDSNKGIKEVNIYTNNKLTSDLLGYIL
jgi:hypothetical protein